MNIDFELFYAETFPTMKELSKFVSCVEGTTIDPDVTGCYAKVALHDAARLVSVADELEKLLPDRPALQVLFYFIAAESVSKRESNFQGSGDSKKHVLRFFGEVCDDNARKRLDRAFSRLDETYMTWDEAAEFLYGVRCDVAHEGAYDKLTLDVEPGRQWYTPGGGEPLGVHITLPELREIILGGAIRACNRMLPSGHECKLPGS